jgi:acetoin utilization deacetylase AcuC-like enzyme
VIPVFFRPEMVAASNVSDSPSAGKPQLVVDDWINNDKIAPHITIYSFEPVSTDQIKVAHDPNFVDEILACTADNGFYNRNPDVAASLPYTSGSLLAGAHWAMKNKSVAMSPTSGFHHAEYSRAMGFCTFNGLMITALDVLRTQPDARILIIDMDMHYGNGTDDIIRKLDLHTQVTNITNGRGYNSAVSLLAICDHKFLPQWLDEQRFDLVIYQAGADIHVDDPYGGLLSTRQMITRDREIFRACAATSTPIVWNLAGGYQKTADGGIEPVLALHRNTMLECIDIYS